MKHTPRTDKIDADMRILNNLANAYLNCKNDEIKAVWKRKWYEMCDVIANRIASTDDNLEGLN